MLVFHSLILALVLVVDNVDALFLPPSWPGPVPSSSTKKPTVTSSVFPTILPARIVPTSTTSTVRSTTLSKSNTPLSTAVSNAATALPGQGFSVQARLNPNFVNDITASSAKTANKFKKVRREAYLIKRDTSVEKPSLLKRLIPTWASPFRPALPYPAYYSPYYYWWTKPTAVTPTWPAAPTPIRPAVTPAPWWLAPSPWTPVASSQPQASFIPNVNSPWTGFDGASDAINASPDPRQIEFLAPITIGKTEVLIDLDTGSSDFWVLSSLLPTTLKNDFNLLNLFNPNVSKTVKWLNDFTWNVSYSDSSFAQGEVILDTVTIGGFAIANQAVGVASNAGGLFVRNNIAHGVMGLAFSPLNTIRPRTLNTLSDNLANFLPNPVFTADLKHKANGTYDFGYIDPQKYNGPINYVPLVPYKPLGDIAFWQFNVTNYQVEGGPVTSAPGTAIADTGTTLIYIGSKMCQDYYAKVSGSQQINGNWYIPCNATLPDMSLSLGKHMATIPGELINAGSVHGQTCAGGLQVGDDSFFVYGDIFFKAFFAVFDMGNERFGFAQKDLDLWK